MLQLIAESLVIDHNIFTVILCGSMAADVSSLTLTNTTEYMRTVLFDPSLSTLTTTISSITWIPFYQFSGNIINSPVWHNTKPVLKLAAALQDSLAFID